MDKSEINQKKAQRAIMPTQTTTTKISEKDILKTNTKSNSMGQIKFGEKLFDQKKNQDTIDAIRKIYKAKPANQLPFHVPEKNLQQIQIKSNQLHITNPQLQNQFSQIFTRSNEPPNKIIEFLTRSQLIDKQNISNGSNLHLRKNTQNNPNNNNYNLNNKRATFEQIFQPNLFLSQQFEQSNKNIKNSFLNYEANQSKDITPQKQQLEQSEVHQQCLICYDNQPDAIFMECGHGGACYNCALDLWKTTGECYLCRQQISSVLQIDLEYNGGNQCYKILSTTKMVEEQVMQIVNNAGYVAEL